MPAQGRSDSSIEHRQRSLNTKTNYTNREPTNKNSFNHHQICTLSFFQREAASIQHVWLRANKKIWLPVLININIELFNKVINGWIYDNINIEFHQRVALLNGLKQYKTVRD